MSSNDKLSIINRLGKVTDHAEADALLLDALSILGQREIVQAFLEARERCGFHVPE